jgi:two-component system chemotaxis sensor kinase CheA
LRAPLRLERVFSTVVHLMRNAIDHGLERPEERPGKWEFGTIGISAREDGGDLVLEVFDDGRGIDAERVVARAVASRTLSPERAERLTPEEALDLIFLDGVSTSDAVTETSGRGVGLAAVKAAVLEAGGTLVVQSQRGRGTRFVMRFPDASSEDLPKERAA